MHGHGKTTLTALILDGQALVKQARSHFLELLAAVDQEATADIADDQFWAEVIRDLQIGIEVQEPGDKTAQMLKAMRAAKSGAACDYSVVAGSKIRSMLIPYMQRLDNLDQRFNQLQERAGK